MRRLARLAAPFLLLLWSAAAFAQSDATAERILLVKGQIEAAEYLGELSPSVEQPADGSDYRIKLGIVEVLIGPPSQPDLYLTLKMTNPPPGDQQIFLLAEQLADGQLQPLYWDFTANGLCIDPETVRITGIEDALKAIQDKYPCRSQPG